MLSVSGELRNIRHPLVRSFRQRQEFETSNRSTKILIIETNFGFGKGAGKSGEQKLMSLLADLESIMADAELKAGRFDCIDIEPASRRENQNHTSFAA